MRKYLGHLIAAVCNYGGNNNAWLKKLAGTVPDYNTECRKRYRIASDQVLPPIHVCHVHLMDLVATQLITE